MCNKMWSHKLELLCTVLKITYFGPLIHCRKNRCPGIRLWQWCLKPPHVIVFMSSLLSLIVSNSQASQSVCAQSSPSLTLRMCSVAARAGVTLQGQEQLSCSRWAGAGPGPVVCGGDWDRADTAACLMGHPRIVALLLAPGHISPALPDYPLQRNGLCQRSQLEQFLAFFDLLFVFCFGYAAPW